MAGLDAAPGAGDFVNSVLLGEEIVFPGAVIPGPKPKPAGVTVGVSGWVAFWPDAVLLAEGAALRGAESPGPNPKLVAPGVSGAALVVAMKPKAVRIKAAAKPSCAK